jgi:hypothetical protein
MLKLRRGRIVGTDPLTVEVDGERRRAWADERLLGEMREGDEVVVNTEALDLGLGSGGFDIVHVNLTRGLDGGGGSGAHVIKLNYTSLQHPIEPVERREEEGGSGRGTGMPVLVLPLHGHLAPAAWAARRAAEGLRVGYVQTAGGALPGRISRDVANLRSLGILCGHVTAAPAYGGEQEALSVAGALDAAAHRLGWDAAIAGAGPGIIGSETNLGHGGMAALDSAHAALALGMRTLVSPRLSEGDPRPRHRGLSHHTRTVLDLLLAEAEVPVPEGLEGTASAVEQIPERHRAWPQPVDLDAYAASGLPTRVMGRELEEDRFFFAAALASGAALAEAAAGVGGD